MTQPNTDTALDTLEKFNNPENFMATRKSFDIRSFNRHRSARYQYVREDGVLVRQFERRDGYKEELSRPDSHYEYEIAYNKNGKLEAMGVIFSNQGVGDVLYFDEAGNFINSKNFDESYLPIPPLRKRFLEQTQTDKKDRATGIDIYNKEKVFWVRRVRHGSYIYYDIYVRKMPGRSDATSYLLDGETGTILFHIDTYWSDGGRESAFYKYIDYINSIGKTQELLSKENADKAQ